MVITSTIPITSDTLARALVTIAFFVAFTIAIPLVYPEAHGGFSDARDGRGAPLDALDALVVRVPPPIPTPR